MKKLIAAAFLMGAAITASAQSGTNSPYSQYGLGVLTDQTSGFNRGMNGVGIGFHEHNQVNYINPASYSAIDSLSFIFDIGAEGQITNFSENGVKKNAHNADLDYIIAGFRAARHLGISFGLVPFTNVGYNYSTVGDVGGNTENTKYVITNSGEGGFHQIYLGAGWEPFRGFAFGANASYLWGKYERTVSNTYTDTYANTLARVYSARVNNYKVDFGLQYTFKTSKKDWLTLGLTYGLGHKLGADAKLNMINNNTETSVSDTTKFVIKNALEIPHMYGGGLMWNHNNKLKVGFDYTLQKWESIDYPTFSVNNGTSSYALQSGVYKNRHKFNLGMDYIGSEYNRHFFQRIHYRAGVSYATPYYKVNGQNGPKEISASIGFGIPIINSYNNRSILNISGQWVNSSAPGLIKENTFRINIGITFNERWFAKWKVE